MWHRLQPAISLLLLAPLVAEYLLGSLSFHELWLFPIMTPMYGGGALLIREAARQNGRGWPTILTLGLAYAFVEEGLATQSLFNPHYLGLHLLDYGYVWQLGIGAPWTVYVLLLHVVWSIAVPISLVEWLFPTQRTTAWLKTFGLAVSLIVFVLGVTLVAFGTRQKEEFVASTTQLTVTALIALGLTVAAFVVFRPAATHPVDSSTTASWNPWALAVLSFVAGSVFQLVTQLGGGYFSPWVAVPIQLALPLAVIAAVHAARSSGLGTDSIADALMLGALLAYCWLGFFLTVRMHGRNSVPGQFFPFAIVVALLAWRYTRRPTTSTD
ncbi:MAG: hypothetical protein AB7G28_09905 [Pirellulales bacterium]